MRITGVDAARGLALLGMAAAHLHATTGPDGRATVVGDLVAGRASALFAVLAGVGIALGSRRGEGAGAALVVRALLVGALGLGLETVLDAPPAVILAQYALLFLVAVPLLRVPAPALFAAAAVWCVASPVLSHVLRAGMPDGPGPQPSFTMPPGELLVTLGLTGYYPVLTWTTYLLVGLGVGRLDLASARTARRLVGTGAALAVLALGSSALLGGGPSGEQRAGITPSDDWAWLLTAARHSGTPFDLAHTTGTALLVLGLCLLAPRVVGAVLAGPGAIPLTLYTAHVVVGGLLGPFGTAVWVLQAVVALVVGGLFRRAGRRGPLEAVVAAASGAVRRRVPA
ncbi:hypothetical protein GCM10017691_15290 [Pseudonocardia petroleophila]|uniref:DUF1624 domain-containing protein n=1 Tax=Pseudonocardia petroleophila TaxID=37331 RepID=A0A7G7MHX5_9PSEU|nr:heparan-alpha-glucosaminide N-acetyltransferase domain-containing protein [Pseudonocardia petroleophila]QNG52386.1 DUF1624 domain-containing protein [Pseudonocardia petroleophila]